jgi:hypothetical protein
MSGTSPHAALLEALTRIEKWVGEFPESGKTWPDGRPMPYGSAYGSNGERDYMRAIAREAIKRAAIAQAAEPPGWELEVGASGWVSIRNIASQCGQDFYQDRDPLIFAFLKALAAPNPGAQENSTAEPTTPRGTVQNFSQS